MDEVKKEAPQLTEYQILIGLLSLIAAKLGVTDEEVMTTFQNIADQAKVKAVSHE